MNGEIFLDNALRRLVSSSTCAIRNGIGWCLEKLKTPAKLRVFEYVDPVSDETIYLYTSKSYSVLCIGDRRFYFDRITGKFDGISSPSSLGVADGLKLPD